jgi:hypothetical protein
MTCLSLLHRDLQCDLQALAASPLRAYRPLIISTGTLTRGANYADKNLYKEQYRKAFIRGYEDAFNRH